VRYVQLVNLRTEWLLTPRSLGDVADSSISQQACATALEKFGRLDGVILNAGTLDPLGTYLSHSLKHFANYSHS
jgi:NAD(P)-dependent dehydrogenase (short-subunit alcohol dehydrogenase family)